jgi:O-antigen/teichoic acid export membrane protein
MGASFVALVLNTALNFALIPHWGMYGAAYATMIAYMTEALVMYSLAQRVYRLEYDLPRTVTAVAVFGTVLVVTQIHWTSSNRPVASVGAGLLSFSLLAVLGYKRINRYFRFRSPSAS